MEPTNMHEAVDQRLVDIQDEVRDAFGWGLEEDLLAAEALVQRTYELVAAAPKTVTRSAANNVARNASKEARRPS